MRPTCTRQICAVTARPGILDADGHRPAVRVPFQGHGHVVEVVDRVLLLLPAVVVEVLAEVAVLVDQADADQGQAQIAGRLQVVAGEDAEAARVERQALVQTELEGEVGDDGALASRRARCRTRWGCSGSGRSSSCTRSRWARKAVSRVRSRPARRRGCPAPPPDCGSACPRDPDRPGAAGRWPPGFQVHQILRAMSSSGCSLGGQAGGDDELVDRMHHTLLSRVSRRGRTWLEQLQRHHWGERPRVWPSRRSNPAFRSMPPPKPTSCPSDPMTRWQGTTRGTGFCPPPAPPPGRHAAGAECRRSGDTNATCRTGPHAPLPRPRAGTRCPADRESARSSGAGRKKYSPS